jgi:transcriptional regulator with XRE-family HTH domain
VKEMDKQEIKSLLNVDNNRILFKGNYLSELIRLASRRTGSQKKLAKKLEFSRDSVISKYKKGLRLPSCGTVKKIVKIAKISPDRLIGNIKEIRKENWWREECGRKGGITTFKKYGSQFYKKLNKRLQEKYDYEYFKNLGLKTYKKYGREHMRKMASKVGKLLPILYPEKKKEWGKKGGMIGTQRQKPTKQEINLIKENIKSGITNFEIHKSIGNSENFKNFDFVYFKDDKVTLVEEVTDVPPERGLIYPKVLDAYKSKKFLERHGLNLPLILTLNTAKKSGNRIRRIPLDAIFILLSEKILPVFDNRNRISLIKKILDNHFDFESYLNQVMIWLEREIKIRIKDIKKGSESQLKSPLTSYEKKLHKTLINNGFKPKGKFILKSKYGETVVDNCLELKNKRIYFEVREFTNRNSLLKSLEIHAGRFFVIKKLYDPDCMCISVLLSKGKITYNGDSKPIKYLKDYADLIINNENLKEIGSLVGGLVRNVG